ncbi:DNA-directed RNA polymerase [Candidatus Micrarchaeota archaeon]|nr:DNA-directed RNA polymerase [Candidatus Micrarchaeota archaeon]
MSFGDDRGRGFGHRKMYKATCSDCGAECEVPFEPREGRPVYCNECFQKHKRDRGY